MRLPSAAEQPRERILRDWVRVELGQAVVAGEAAVVEVVHPARACTTSRKVLSIYRPSAGFPASTRRINSLRTIYSSCPSVMTSTGSPETLPGVRFLVTGNGAAISR